MLEGEGCVREEWGCERGMGVRGRRLFLEREGCVRGGRRCKMGGGV